MKLSISLNKPKTSAAPTALQRPPPPAFSLVEEDDEEKNGLVTKPPVVSKPSKVMQRRMEEEKKVDATVYEYDEFWDSMQEAKARQQMAKELDATTRKPKYIHNLLSSAATRKLDHLRAEEKMMQKEREAEGDMYNDKEVFVTQAYKDQMEEVRKAEEEEKQREEARKRKGGFSTGMTHFYRQLLEESEQKHEATVQATQKRFIGPQIADGNLTIVKPAHMTVLSDVELARRAREEGKEVELNDDGQIVDKTQLLNPGLNLSLPNTRNISLLKATRNGNGQEVAAPVHRAVGTAASRQEINERRERELRQQFEQEKERLREQQKREEERTTQNIIAKRNNETDVESARMRYLERRKRQKLEETPTNNT